MSRKIKILWIADCVPYNKIPHAGGQTFNFYFQNFKNSDLFDIKLLATESIENKRFIEKNVTDMDCNILYWDSFALGKLSRLNSIIVKYNPFNKYGGAITGGRKDFLKLLRKYKRYGYSPCVIILEWTCMVLLAEDLKKLFPESILVASEHDVNFVAYDRKRNLFTGLHKAFGKIRSHYVKKAEIDALKLCNLVLTHNPDNINLLNQNGIAKEKLQWLTPYFHNMVDIKRTCLNRDIIFFGQMGRKENYLSVIWFIENVMFKMADLKLRFIIIGANPPKQLKAYCSEKIIVTGFVDDITNFFANSMCMVAPLVLGAGIKVKVLEGLSSGIPVLTNHIGIEGIPATNNKHYFHCETAGDYIRIIRKLYNKEIDINYIENNAKSFISGYSLENSFSQYKDSVIKLVNS